MLWVCAVRLQISAFTSCTLHSSTLRAPHVISLLSTGCKRLRSTSQGLFDATLRPYGSRMLMNSSSATNSPLVYDWQDDVEELENYRLGGYHPIQLGDEFSNARYRVVHKLGHGGSSTVWLARDRMENRYVSLKIIAAEQSKTSQEAKIRDRLRCGDLRHPGHPFVLSLLDDFHIEGPNGCH